MTTLCSNIILLLNLENYLSLREHTLVTIECKYFMRMYNWQLYMTWNTKINY